MAESLNTTISNLNIYEEDLNEDTTLDIASQSLNFMPGIENKRLCVLYAQNNDIKMLPEDFFESLPSLMYLDLRDNQLTDLPKSIKNHNSLTHLLLTNNKLTSLPNELGTVINLKVLQLSGNPLMYPPRDVINAGIMFVKTFLHDKFLETAIKSSQSDMSEDMVSIAGHDSDLFSPEAISYNSVIDGDKINKAKTMSVRLYEKDSECEEEIFTKVKGKCPKLAKSREKNPPYSQSSKYVKPEYSYSKQVQDSKIKQSYSKDLAIQKHKDFIATRDKILQGRKNLELLKKWRNSYIRSQFCADGTYKLDAKDYPYGTNPEYMQLLTREDIEKDLPDKYRKKLLRRCKPSVPRKSNNDVHLALKIKQLFENLEAIDLNRKDMTPRTEQKMLMSEIQKITEIKQKLMELSTTNAFSVDHD